MTVNRRPGLGRGLGELFQRTDGERVGPPRTGGHIVDHVSAGAASPTTPAEPAVTVGGARFAEIPIDAISPNPRQPRTVFDEEAMAELVESISEVGLLQPVVVRSTGDDRYELVMGERRWRASRQAGRTTIPAIVRQTGETDLLRDALLENLHRAQLNPLEEAAAYQQMLEDFDCTQEELAQRVKRSRPQISNAIRLLRLPGTVQRRVAAGVLSAGHARALLMIEDRPAQERLAQRIVAEGLSVRAVEELVALGETGSDDTPTRSRRPKERSERTVDLENVLADRFETRVSIDHGRTRGRITIQFAGEDDLGRILTVMGVLQAESPTD